ncbi:MAG: flippase [Clostridia bacterium]|nr:flippase [Clostridia bacterium]
MASSNQAEKGYRIAKNYAYSLLYQIFTIITPLITTPYISRVLGAANIGIFGYVESIGVYFIMMGNFGFPFLGQREIAYTSDDLEKRSQRFADIMLGKTFFLSIALVAYIIFSLFFAKDNKIIFLSFALGIIADLLQAGWFFQGIEDFRTTVIRNFIIKITSIVSIFLFVKTANDLLIYSLLLNGANVIGNLFVVFALRNKISLKNYKVSMKRVFSFVKPALILAIPYYISSVYAVIDKTMIGSLCNYSEVGYYEQSQKIIKFSLALVTALGTVFMPRIAKEVKSRDRESVKLLLSKGIDAILLISFPLCAGLLCVGEMMTPWFFGAGFEPVGVLIMTFAPMALFLGLNSFLGDQYLAAAKKEKLLTIAILVGVVINVIVNAILIPKLASLGAAIATVTSEFCKLIFLMICLRGVVEVKHLLLTALKCLLLTLPMFAVGVITRQTIFSEYSITNTLLLVVLCCVVYFCTLVVTKNEFVMAFFDLVKKKLHKKS